MSKGSTPRPLSVSDQEYAERWDMIFKRDLENEETEEKPVEEQTDENINLG